jgi:putative hydrolase
MSDLGPFGSGGPFEDIMRNLARMFATQGPVNWEIARQFAQWSATGGTPESNVDPLARVRLEELLRVAEMHVAEATGYTVSARGALGALTVTPGDWALRTLEAWKPLLETLAKALGDTLPDGGGPGAGSASDPTTDAATLDPMAQVFGQLPQMVGPFLFGMQAGSMVGALGQRAMGTYDLPMPRPPSDDLLLVPATIDTFAEEWSLGREDVRMWICLREATNHTVLGRPHVRRRLDEMIAAYVGAFEPDPRVVEDRLAGLDPTDMSAMQSAFSDPTALLGEMQNDAQRRLQVPLRAMLAAVSGYVDHIMETVGHRLITGYGPLTEALHRRRLEESSGARVLGQLFGVDLDAATYERGQAFVRGVVERAGEPGLARLWHSVEELPTPAEVDAPGLWLARIDLPGDAPSGA